jgi:hypothetical protein
MRWATLSSPCAVSWAISNFRNILHAEVTFVAAILRLVIEKSLGNSASFQFASLTPFYPPPPWSIRL